MDKDNLYLYALRELTRSAQSRKEMAIKLSRRAENKSVVAEIINDLVSQGYLNEKNLAEDFVVRGKEMRLAARRLLKWEMHQKGLSEQLAEETLNEHFPEEAELEVARTFAERKMRFNLDLPLDKRLRRLADALGRRGFSGEIIGQIIREYQRDS